MTHLPLLTPSRLALSGLALTLLPAPAAIITLEGGVEGGTDLQSQDRYVIDLGFRVPSLPASPDLALFEAGGDGDGTGIAVLGSSLHVYLDTRTSSIFAEDTSFSVDLTPFAGQTVSIRLQGNYTGTTAGSDTAQLDVFNGTDTLTSNLITLTSDHDQAAGGDGFGTGGRGQNSWPGITEANGTGGTPDMAQFSTGYDIGDGGPNVLGNDVLVGTLYTGATDSDGALAAGIPDPASWNLIPEPSSGILALLGTGLLVGSRRRPA